MPRYFYPAILFLFSVTEEAVPADSPAHPDLRQAASALQYRTAHPQEKLGEMAAELLLGLLKEGNIPESERQILVKPELVIRESCRSRKKEE